MKMPWFRLYSEARTDAKLRALSDEHFRVWFNLLCYASEQADRGRIAGVTEYVVAVEVADGDVELLRNACNALHALQVVTCDFGNAESVEIRFQNFTARQSDKPSADKERVRSRVAKSRAKKASVDVTPCNAPVTPGNAAVTRCNAQEEELEEELKTPPTPQRGAVLATEVPKTPRAKPEAIPDPPDWIPAAAWADWTKYRKRCRAPVTAKAAELWVRELSRFRDEGQDPVAVIEQSIAKGWQGLFPVKKDPAPGPNGRHTGGPSPSAPYHRAPANHPSRKAEYEASRRRAAEENGA